jgi:hypothetical protein
MKALAMAFRVNIRVLDSTRGLFWLAFNCLDDIMMKSVVNCREAADVLQAPNAPRQAGLVESLNGSL